MKTILLVDDNMEFQTMLSDYFADLGYKIERAPDGREGLIKAKALKPDIILLDVMKRGRQVVYLTQNMT